MSNDTNTSYNAYSPYYTTCNDDGNYTSGERALWRAVITQALMDISSNSKKMIDRVERARALAWFSLRNPDFISVCALADMDPKYVVKKVKEALERNCKWRKEPSKNKEGKQDGKKKHALAEKPSKPPQEIKESPIICYEAADNILQFA